MQLVVREAAGNQREKSRSLMYEHHKKEKNLKREARRGKGSPNNQQVSKECAKLTVYTKPLPEVEDRNAVFFLVRFSLEQYCSSTHG